MSSRLSCWVRGHVWGHPRPRIYDDLFGNEWRQQFCTQCHARRRVLHRPWWEAER